MCAKAALRGDVQNQSLLENLSMLPRAQQSWRDFDKRPGWQASVCGHAGADPTASLAEKDGTEKHHGMCLSVQLLGWCNAL